MPDVYDITGAFQDIELDLIKSMKRNMKRHIGEEFQEGINWSQWQAEMLNGLAQYKEENRDKLPKYFSTINSEIDEAIKQAYAAGESEQEIELLEAIKNGYKADKAGKGTDALQGAFFKINDNKLNALIKATTDDFNSAESAILRMADDVYRQTIFKTQMFYNTGAKSLWQAVDMATKDFLAAGINCVEYKNGARVNIASYSEMALRTANKRANLMGAGNKREEYGINTVKVSTHYSACPMCIEWQGRVYYDDVYGSVKGLTTKKYPMLSEAIKGGMFHPNCRNGLSTYYEGINEPPKAPTKEETEEMARRYNLQQEQRLCERNIRKYKRLENGCIDADNIKKYANKRKEWTNKYNELIVANPDILRAEPQRLKLYGITATDLKPAIKAVKKAGSIRNYSGELAKGFGTTHYDAMHDIIDECNHSTLKSVWDKYEDELRVGNAHQKGGAYAMGKSLYLNIDNCAMGNYYSKPFQTVFHEAGHGIDSAGRSLAVNNGGVFANHFSGAYKGGLFPQTIKEEVNNLVNAYDKKLKAEFKAHATDADWLYDNGYIKQLVRDKYKETGVWAWGIEPKYSKSYAYKALEKEINGYSSYARADLSDILEGATSARVQCGFGHGKKYWSDRTIGGIADGLATEAFAEMTDSTFTNPESLELIKKYLPKSYKLYEEMLEVLLNG